MASRDYRDILSGGLVLLAGAFIAFYAQSSYDMGSVRQMGPGMYPFWLGVLMVVLGACIAVPAFLRPGPMPKFRIFAPLFVLLSIAAFAYTIPRMGLIPAIAFQVFVSTLAEKRFNPLGILTLVVALCMLGYTVFSFLLGLTIPLVRWPF